MRDLKEGDIVFLTDGSSVVVGALIGEGGQGKVYRARHNDKDCALKWYYNAEYFDNKDYYENLVNLTTKVNERNGIFNRFALPIQLTKKEEDGQFGYVMDLIPDSMVSMTKILNGQCDFKDSVTELEACKKIVEELDILHKSNMAFMDINDGSIFFDLNTGDVKFCDCDNISTGGSLSISIGKMGYMAPEVCLGKSVCNKQSDEFSLAVILYRLLVQDRPFEGKAVVGIMDREKEIEIFGKNPVFTFDPNNDSNRPRYPEVITRWNTEIPDEIKDYFTATFTEGIHDPEKRTRNTWWIGELQSWINQLKKNPFKKLQKRLVIKKDELLLFIVDSSMSMKGLKMDEVNKAIIRSVSTLKELEDESDVRYLLNVLQFSKDCQWLHEKPLYLSDFTYHRLEPTGRATNADKAFMALDVKLTKEDFMHSDRECKPPIIILISDGQSIGYDDALCELNNNKNFQKSYKIAIGVDDDRSKSDKRMLEKFTGNEDYILTVEQVDDKLGELIHQITVVVSRSAAMDSMPTTLLRKFRM